MTPSWVCVYVYVPGLNDPHGMLIKEQKGKEKGIAIREKKIDSHQALGLLASTKIVCWKNHPRLIRLQGQLLIGRAPRIVVQAFDFASIPT